MKLPRGDKQHHENKVDVWCLIQGLKIGERKHKSKLKVQVYLTKRELLVTFTSTF